VNVTWTPSGSQPPKRLLFKQFYQVYSRLKDLTIQTPSTEQADHLLSSEPTSSVEKECIICMEKDATLVLPCCHSFCEDCISKWKSKNETCPVCRVTVANVQTNECFVLTKPLTDTEVQTHFTNILNSLVLNQTDGET